MPYTEINYSRRTFYKGRNGIFNQTGIVINVSEKAVGLYPLNTRGYTDAAILMIPLDDLMLFSARISQIAKDYELSKM